MWRSGARAVLRGVRTRASRRAGQARLRNALAQQDQWGSPEQVSTGRFSPTRYAPLIGRSSPAPWLSWRAALPVSRSPSVGRQPVTRTSGTCGPNPSAQCARSGPLLSFSRMFADCFALGSQATYSGSSLICRTRPCVFRPSWTAFQADRGRDFSVIVDGVSV